MRLLPQLLALAVAGASALAVGFSNGPVFAAGPAPAASSVAAREPGTEEGLTIEVGAESSGVLRPGDDLTLTVMLVNRSASLIPEGTASIHVEDSAVGGREELAAWLDADDGNDGASDRALGAALSQVPTPQLFSGTSAILPPIVIPASSLTRLRPTDFAAHRVAVRVASAGGSLGEAHTAVTVDPGTAHRPVSLALAMPTALPPSTDGILPADLLETYTSSTGPLSRQLDQAAGRPIAIGVDPRIIASVRALGDSAPESAVEWLRRLDAVPNDTFPLAYADSDVSATSQIGRGVPGPTSIPVDPALFPNTAENVQPGSSPSPSTGSDAPEQALPTLETLLEWDYTVTGIAWPRDSTIVGQDLETFAAAGMGTTIVSSANSSVGLGDDTPGASARVGERAVLTSDQVISDLLRKAVRAPTSVEWRSAMTSLTASLAALSDDGGADGRVVLATLGRDWPEGAYRLGETLDALAPLPWAPGAPLSAALAAGPAKATIVDSPVDEGRRTQLASVFAKEDAVGSFSTVLADPSAITGEHRLALLAITGQAWAVTDIGWPAAVTDYLERSDEITSSVAVVESSTINLRSVNGQLPISVSNDLDHPVTVTLSVQAENAILAVLDPQVEVTIEPNSQNRALVSVQSVANGRVAVTLTLASTTGVPISQPTTAIIDVQAGWETAITSALGAVVVAIFVLGIIRTVRRRRRLSREGASEPGGIGVASPGAADD